MSTTPKTKMFYFQKYSFLFFVFSMIVLFILISLAEFGKPLISDVVLNRCMLGVFIFFIVSVLVPADEVSKAQFKAFLISFLKFIFPKKWFK